MTPRRRLRCKTAPQTPPRGQAPAETAPREPETSEEYWPVRTANFDIAYAVNMLAAVEENKNPSSTWHWDGGSYLRSHWHPPSQSMLANHAEVLCKLLTLAPNGYPDTFNLYQVLRTLHFRLRIFNDDYGPESREKRLWRQASSGRLCASIASGSKLPRSPSSSPISLPSSAS